MVLARRLLAVVVAAALVAGTAAGFPAAERDSGAAPPERAATDARCVGALGRWCGGYYTQPPAPLRRPPVLGKPCPRGCSGIGACHGDRGACVCPAGAGGPACADAEKRPCTKSFRDPRASRAPNSHIGADKRDLNWTEPGSTYSRCAL